MQTQARFVCVSVCARQHCCFVFFFFGCGLQMCLCAYVVPCENSPQAEEVFGGDSCRRGIFRHICVCVSEFCEQTHHQPHHTSSVSDKDTSCIAHSRPLARPSLSARLSHTSHTFTGTEKTVVCCISHASSFALLLLVSYSLFFLPLPADHTTVGQCCCASIFTSFRKGAE